MNTKISKKMMRMLAFTLALAMALTSAFSTSMLSNAAAKPKKITLKAKKATLYAGEQFQISLKSVTPKKADKKLKYAVDKKGKKFITVKKNGLVTAKKVKKNGKAKVTVTAKKNKKAKAVVKFTVKKGTVNKSIKIANQTMLKGTSKKLAVTWNPAKTSSKKLSGWTSSNKKVATVTTSGSVKAVAKGTATITVKNSYGKKASAKITVTEPVVPNPTAAPTAPPTATPDGSTATPDPTATPSDPTATPSDPTATPSDPTATPEAPMPTVNPVKVDFTSDAVTLISGTQTIPFSSFTDGESIDLNNYTQMVMKVTLYSDEAGTEPIKEFTAANSPNIKLTLDNATTSFGSNGSWLAYMNNWVPGGGYLNPAASLDPDTGLISSEIFDLTPTEVDPEPDNEYNQYMTQAELDGTDCITIQASGSLGTAVSLRVSALVFDLKELEEPIKRPALDDTLYELQGETSDGNVSYDELPADDTRYNTSFAFGEKEYSLNFTSEGIINQISKIAALSSEAENWTNTDIYQADYGMFYIQAVGDGATKSVKVIDAYEDSEQFAGEYVATLEQDAENANVSQLTLDSADPRMTDVITITDDTEDGEVTLEGTLFGTPFALTIDKATNSFVLEKDGAFFAEFVNGAEAFELIFAAAADVTVEATKDLKPITATDSPATGLEPDLSNAANFATVGDGVTAEWNAIESALQVHTVNYHQGVVLKFTLPEGTNLSDYDALKADIKLGAADDGKQLRVDSADSMTYAQITENGTLGISGSVSSPDNYTPLSISLDTATLNATTGEIYLAVGLHAGASDGGSDYFIKNVRLAAKQVPVTVDLSNAANSASVGTGATVAWDTTESELHVQTTNYHQGAVLKLTLPEGTTLADFDGLKLDIRLGATDGGKQLKVDSADSLTYAQVTENGTLGKGGTWLSTTSYVTETVVLNTADMSAKTGDVYLALGLHAGASDGAANFYIKNVQLLRK